LTFFSSVLLGFFQGIAEFLPISSSGHLSLLQNILGLNDVGGDLFFDVLLHLGTLLAVFVVYRRDVAEMVRDLIALVRGLMAKEKKIPPTEGVRMVLLLLVATLPLFAILPVKDRVESLYTNTMFIGFALLATGFLLFASDRVRKPGKKTIRSATILDALLVGCGQAIAVVPGLSRSGTTISLGMLRGLDRKFAVRFSFLLSIPAVLGANILEIGDAVRAGIDTSLLPVYLLGVAVAAVAGFFAIHLVNLLAQKGKFGKFAYYCWTVGVIVIFGTFLKTTFLG
jgi:undecaprenyl-diphosphatase